MEIFISDILLHSSPELDKISFIVSLYMHKKYYRPLIYPLKHRKLRQFERTTHDYMNDRTIEVTTDCYLTVGAVVPDLISDFEKAIACPKVEFVKLNSWLIWQNCIIREVVTVE